MEWQGLEHALECFVLKFDGAVKIIRRDQRVLCSMIVRSKPRKKGRIFLAMLANDPPRSRSIGPAFDLTVYS